MSLEVKTDARFGLSGIDYPLGPVLKAVGAVLIFEVRAFLMASKAKTGPTDSACWIYQFSFDH